MSAKIVKEDKKWLLGITPKQRLLNPYEETMVLSTFDTETEFDVKKIQNDIKQIKFLKLMSLSKVLLFIPEYIIALIFFNKAFRKNKVELTKIYWKFLRNKISYPRFKTDLNAKIKESFL